MMGSRVGETHAEGSNRGFAQRARIYPREFLRVEMLETRCLLSGWPKTAGPALAGPIEVKAPASEVAWIPSDDLRLPIARQDHDSDQDGGSASGPESSPGPVGLPPENYVVIHESSAPHDTLSSAQALPDLPYFGVVGSLGMGDGADLYQFTLNSIPDRIDFGLVMKGSGSNVPATLQLVDGSGQVLGTWRLGSLGSSTIQVDLENVRPGTPLYLGVSSGNPGSTGGSSGAVDYQLWVAHESGPRPTASTAVGSPQPGLASPVLSPLLIPLAAVGPASTQGDSSSVLSASSSTSVSLSVTVGSLAIRSAGASRGLLSNDDPAPLAGQGPGDTTSREVTASTARTDSERGGEPRAGEPAVPGRDASVVVLSTGGFPLMGATAVGYWREHGPPLETVPEMISPSREDSFEAVESTGEHFLESSPAEVLAEGQAVAKEPAFRFRAWGNFPVSVYSGLGVATVLTLNAVLSQPIAGYDYLTAKLYRSRIRGFARRKPTS
jgi:hypothetical protein